MPKNTGSAFSLNVAMPSDSVTITGKSLATYEDRSGASGNPFFRTFCSRCGSPISGRGAAYEARILEFLSAVASVTKLHCIGYFIYSIWKTPHGPRSTRRGRVPSPRKARR
jgi:hypothetical protein